MRKSFLLTGLVAGATLTLAIAGFKRIDRKMSGIPGFVIWKKISHKARRGEYADVNGITLYYETFGKGPPVVALHGGTAFIESMHFQITDLASDRFVVAPDSRGHGRSLDGPGPLHYTDMADDVIGLMDRLNIAKADVVGWSDGGIVGMDIAMRHPHRIGRLVTIGANFDVDGMIDPASPLAEDSAALDGARKFYQRVSPTPQNWPILCDKVHQMWMTEPHYTIAELGLICAPVLVMAGEFDAIRRDHTNELVQAIPSARMFIIPGASHFAPLEDPKAVNSAIREFLAPVPDQ